MEKYFALIKNNIVESVVIGTDEFLSHIKDKYDHVIDVTESDRPSTGDSYYKDTEEFISNAGHTHHIPVDLDEDHLKQGTEDGFEPFKISKYSVSYKDGFIYIGCKKYSAAGFLDVLHKGLIEKQQTIGVFTSTNGPSHGKFGITWEDAQKLYDALIKVKF